MICRVCPYREYNFETKNHVCKHSGITRNSYVSIKQGWEPLWCPLEPMILVFGMPMKKKDWDMMVTETGKKMLALIPDCFKKLEDR